MLHSISNCEQKKTYPRTVFGTPTSVFFSQFTGGVQKDPPPLPLQNSPTMLKVSIGRLTMSEWLTDGGNLMFPGMRIQLKRQQGEG
jgi:hypothetical protein